MAIDRSIFQQKGCQMFSWIDAIEKKMRRNEDISPEKPGV